MLRHIAWFTEAPIAPRPEGGLTSDDESVRRRYLTPAHAIEKLGVGCSVFGHLHDADPVHVSRHLQKLNADIVVLGDLSGAARLRLARAAKHLGCYVVVDFSEEAKDLAPLLQVADAVVASTAKIAEALELQTENEVFVIPDCDEKGDDHSPEALAHLWLDAFKHLKLKPPSGANTNIPQQA